MTEPVFRFAPSPNGDLHLGHALSAILNHDAAKAEGGRFLVRIEDIDGARSRPEYIERILDDLAWLGLSWEEPVRRQSEHVDLYRSAVERLTTMGLTYPAFASRSEIKAAIAAREAASGVRAPRDPDGTALHPPIDRERPADEIARKLAAGEPHALRLKIDEAVALAGALDWEEAGDMEATGRTPADPLVWGDVVLSRKDAPASYHVAVVVDDADQGVTDVVRGVDLYRATAVHRLLQTLLGLPAPRYRHHHLVYGPDRRKLSKSAGSMGLRALRGSGITPAQIRRLLSL